MNDSLLRKISAGISIAIAAAIVAVLLYDLSALMYSRILFPYQLEWEEGLILNTSLLFAKYGVYYPSPSAEFIPSLYPPVSFFVYSIITQTHQPFLYGRLISLFLYAGACILLFFVLKKKYGFLLSVSAVFIIPLSYPVTGYWFDTIRVDAFQIFFLTLLLFLCVRMKVSLKQLSSVSLIFLLAVFSKQSAIILLIFMIAYYALQKRIFFSIFFSIFSIVLILLFIFIMQQSTDGFFWLYIWEVGNSHPLIEKTLWLSLKKHTQLIQFQMPYLFLPFFLMIGYFLYRAFRLIQKQFYLHKANKVVPVSNNQIQTMSNVFRNFFPERKLSLESSSQEYDLTLMGFAISLTVLSFSLSIHEGTFLNNHIPFIYALPIIILYASRAFTLLLLSGLRFLRKISFKRRVILSAKKTKILVALLPAFTILTSSYVMYHNYKNSSARILQLPGVSESSYTEAYKMKSLLHSYRNYKIFSDLLPVPFLTSTDAMMSYHYMSLNDLRNHPFLKSKVPDMDAIQKQYDLLLIEEDYNFADFKKYHLSEFGIQVALLLPKSGLRRHPRYLYIKKGLPDPL